MPPIDPILGDTWVCPADEMIMVYVPPGTFMMGSDERDLEAEEDEFPAHAVALSEGFWIDRTEVMSRQYQNCVTAGACVESVCGDGSSHQDSDDQPVVCVSWEDAGCAISSARA